MTVKELMQPGSRYYTYNINPNIGLKNQTDELMCELIQSIVKIGSYDFIFDLGWYPDKDPNGGLTLMIKKDDDWDFEIREFDLDYKNLDNELFQVVDALRKEFE